MLVLINELLLYLSSGKLRGFFVYLAGVCTRHPSLLAHHGFAQMAIVFTRIGRQWPNAIYAEARPLVTALIPRADWPEAHGYVLAVDMVRDQGHRALGDPPHAEWDYMSENGGHLTTGPRLPEALTRFMKRCSQAWYVPPFWLGRVIDHPRFHKTFLVGVPTWVTQAGLLG